MKAACVEAINKAAGRQLSVKELVDMESRIRYHLQRAPTEDESGLKISASERLDMAVKAAEEDAMAEVKKQAQRLALTIAAKDRIDKYAATQPNKIEALSNMLANQNKSGVVSVERSAEAIRNMAVGEMMEVTDILKGKFIGLVNDAAGNRDLVRELHGEKTGNDAASIAAKQFHKVAEDLRVMFNGVGGKIGRLEDWGMPHNHSQSRIATTPFETWLADTMPLLNRDKYRNIDGSKMTDQQMSIFLKEAHTTIATDGANKIEPGQAHGMGMKANAHSEQRSIHFKDGDSYLAYHNKYGEDSLLSTLTNTIDRSARDIAMIKALGPNPAHMARQVLDEGYKAELLKDPTSKDKMVKKRHDAEGLFETVSGSSPEVASRTLANNFSTYRNLNVAGMLGSSVITKVAELSTVIHAAMMHQMPVTRVLANELRMLNPLDASHRRQAQRAGLGINMMLGGLNNFGYDGLGTTNMISGKVAKFSRTLAATVLKGSGLTAFHSAGQKGFGGMLMDQMGERTIISKSMQDLKPNQESRLRAGGITDNMWSIWHMAKPEDWRGAGDTVLTPQSIYKVPDSSLQNMASETGLTPKQLKDDAAIGLMSYVAAETGQAIIEPGAREHAMMHSGSVRGTWRGELGHSFWQFKSFALSMFGQHYTRMMSLPTMTSRATYLATLMPLTMAFGAVALQLNEIASGRDPRDMSKWQFWVASMLKAGTLGLYGDFLLGDNTGAGQSPLAALTGPIASDTELGIKALQEARNAGAGGMSDDPKADKYAANAGGDAVKLLKYHVPFANLWYTKAATDHMIFQNLQEMFSPGYLRRMEQRAKRQFGQDYWWRPGEALPERAPDVTAAAGK